MELGRTKNWFYVLLAAAMGFIFVLGAWWLYLVFKLAQAVDGVSEDVPANLILMVKWEGVSFFLLILALGAALFYVFWQDHKKTKSLQTFYASLTHELKTPLASMRLQTQVLIELLQDLNMDKERAEKVERYGNRLQEDIARLENELDKRLHLSRLEGGGNLNFSPIALIPLIQSEIGKFPSLQLEIKSRQANPSVNADQTALRIILKNLFENTVRHNKAPDKKATIEIVARGDEISLIYDDHGEEFGGNASHLGRLFYKHDSPKGSGIGLFLARRLARRQGGRLLIKTVPRLIFELRLKRDMEE